MHHVIIISVSSDPLIMETVKKKGKNYKKKERISLEQKELCRLNTFLIIFEMLAFTKKEKTASIFHNVTI